MTLAYQAPRLVKIPGNITDSGAVHFWENAGLFAHGIQRCFWISRVKSGETRGNHAHWREAQVIVALNGEVDIQVEGLDGSRSRFLLDCPDKGLYIPPLNWIEISFSEDAVLLGLGDLVFEEEDFIRDKSYFDRLKQGEV